MHNQELSRQIQRLTALIKRTNDACGENIELRADWAKYICVLGAGLIENGLKTIYMDYAQRTVSKPIADFISSTLSQIRNPKLQRFTEIAAAFKESWKDDLESFATTDGRGDALDSIMNHRHLIAHGKSHASNITLIQVKTYLEKSIAILEFVEQQCKR